MASIEGVDGVGTSDMDSHSEDKPTESILEPDRENRPAKNNKNASPSKVPETPKDQEQVDPATSAGDGNAQSSLDTKDEVTYAVETGKEHPSAQTGSESEKNDTSDDDEESSLKPHGGASLSSYEDFSMDQDKKVSLFNVYKTGHVPGDEPASPRRGDDPRGEPGAGPEGGRRSDHADVVQGQQQEHDTPDQRLKGPCQPGTRSSSGSSDSIEPILNDLGENTSDNEEGHDASGNISLPVFKMAQDTTDGAYKQNMPDKQPAFVIVNRLNKFMIKHVESGKTGLLPKAIKPGSNMTIDDSFLEDDTGNIFEISYSNSTFEYNQIEGEGVVKQSNTQVATLDESDKTLSKSTRNDFNKDDTLCDKFSVEKTPHKTPDQDEFVFVQTTECTEENNSDLADPPGKTKNVFVKNQDVSADSRPENNQSDGSMDSKADINSKGIKSRLDNTGPQEQNSAPVLHKRPTTADPDYTSSSQPESPPELLVYDNRSTIPVLADPADQPAMAQALQKIPIISDDESADKNQFDGTSESKADINSTGIQSRLKSTGPKSQDTPPALPDRPKTAGKVPGTGYTTISQQEGASKWPVDDTRPSTPVSTSRQDFIPQSSIQVTTNIVFNEVFDTSNFKEIVKQRYPEVTLSLKTFETEDLVAVQLSGSEMQLKEAEDFVTKYSENYTVNIISLGEIKLGDQLEKEFLYHLLEQKFNQIQSTKQYLYAYINTCTAKISMCHEDQGKLDAAVSELKTCIKKRELCLDEIMDQGKRDQFLKYINNKEQGNTVYVVKKDNKCCIFGITCDVQEIEAHFKDIQKETRDLRNAAQQMSRMALSDKVEQRLRHLEYSACDLPSGHAITVAKGDAQDVWEQLLIELQVVDNDQTTECDAKPCPDGRFTMRLAIPSWKGGNQKEKDSVHTAVSSLLKKLEGLNLFKISMQLDDVGKWQADKLLKLVLYPLMDYMKESKNAPLSVVICCSQSKNYSSCVTVCKEAFKTGNWTYNGTDKSKTLFAKVVKGNIDECEVDVIINSTNDKLDFSMGTVSKLLLQKAGYGLQEEANRKHQYPMDLWEIVETKGYNLQCQYVFHGYLDYAATNTKQKLKKLKDLTFSCLKKAEAKKCRTIAFPALGTGNLGYRPAEVAKAMFEAVEDFREKYKECTLEEVIFVIYHKDRDAIQAFENEKKRRETTMQEPQAMQEPEAQTIHMKDREAEENDPASLEDKEIMQTKKSQWNPCMLMQTDQRLKRYVVVRNIPEKYEMKELAQDLFIPPFPVRVPYLVYSKWLKEAVLICWTEDDAVQLSKYTSHGGLSFTSLFTTPLDNFVVSYQDQEIINQLGSFKDAYIKEMEYFDIKAEFSQNMKELIIRAPTKCQINFALEKIYMLVGKEGGPRKKRQKVPSISEFEHVDSFTITEVHWDILRTLYGQLLNDLQKEASVAFLDGSVVISSKKLVPHWQALKKAGVELSDKQTEEIPLDDIGEEKAISYCKDVCVSLKTICCIYVADRKKVYAFGEKYEDLKSTKHQFRIKQGKIHVTGRKGRHLGLQNDTSKASTEEKQMMDTNFNWDYDASDLKTFDIPEGITVKVYKANLLKAPVDCIVNAANEHLGHGGGVARVIADAAGPKLIAEGDEWIKQMRKLPVGNAVATTAGDLPYKCVIHAVGPTWYDYRPFSLEDIERCEKDLYCAITNSFVVAEKKGHRSVAIPAISSAIFAVPEEICTYQYALATLNYGKKTASESSLREIHFVDINRKIVAKIQESFEQIKLDDSRPYTIQKYVQKGSSPVSPWGKVYNNDQKGSFVSSGKQSEVMSHSMRSQRSFTQQPKDAERITSFEPVQYEEKGSSVIIFGPDQQLNVCQGDLFTFKADALLTVEDRYGSGSGAVSTSINQTPDNWKYSKEKRQKFSHAKEVGDVVVTCGFNYDFKKVFHVVFPYDMISEHPDKRKRYLMTAYDRIFKTAVDGNVKSLTMTLFGTGSDKPENVNLSANAFLDSYLVHCNKCRKALTIFLVCRDKIKFSSLCDMFRQTVDDCSTQKPPPGTPTPDTVLEQALDKTPKKEVAFEHPAAAEQDTCVICMDTVEDPRTLDCGHLFCTSCIKKSLEYKQACPTCGKMCGVIKGDQPDGRMTNTTIYRRCAGYENFDTLMITYHFPTGIQGDNHPKPGAFYESIQRSAYLPDNREGNIILQMLTIAFDRKLVFTIGSSRTTGQEGVITWNDIHHKTNIQPHGKFGYPDATYLQRVTEELAAKGVTEKDISGKKMKAINKRFNYWKRTN